MQGERRSQVYLDYAEPQPIFVQASAIELAHIAERSRKCQEKVHEYEPITVLHTDIGRLEALLK